jgi:hypothetical protein
MKAGFFVLGMAAIVALSSGCSGPTGLSGTGPRPVQFVNFDSSDVGKPPQDFTTALTGSGGPVSWVVRQDFQSPEGRPVLVQESAEVTNYRFPLCIYEKIVARDVAVEVEWKSISGTLDEAGGIVLRYRPGNYYIARANALENNVILFKTVNGQRSKIEEVPAAVAAGQWHRLSFEAKGTRLKITFDGKTTIDRDDATFSNPGKIGLWTKADSVSAFTALKIEPAP